MTILSKEALATPSEQMLLGGQDQSQAVAYVEVLAALQAYRGVVPSASAQFAGTSDPRHVVFNLRAMVSASALAGATLVASTAAGTGVTGIGEIRARIAQHGLSVQRGSLTESERAGAALTTSASALLPLRAETDDDLLNWETPIAAARPPGGHVMFHMREGTRRPFRLVSDD